MEKIKKQYIELVQDLIDNDTIAPTKTLSKKKNWICYCGDTYPTIELKGLIKNLESKNIKEIVIITFVFLEDINVRVLNDISYEKLDNYYHNNHWETGIDYKNVILTTEKLDFICFKDSENECFAICGEKDLVEDAFLGRTYEKMKKVFMKSAQKQIHHKSLYEYWLKFFKYYESLSN